MAIHWSTHQLTEYLVSVSDPSDLAGALRVGLERAIEALDAEVGAVVIDGRVTASIGFGSRGAPPEFAAAVRGAAGIVTLTGTGDLYLAGADLDRGTMSAPHRDDRLVVGRLSEPCSAEETQMLNAFALVLGLVRHNLQTLGAERGRHRLVNTLLSIQRAISARHPLQELLDAVTEGAASLLQGAPVALLLADPAAPGALIPASLYGTQVLDAEMLDVVPRAMGTRTGSSVAASHGVIASPVVVDGSSAGCLVARVAGSAAEGTEYGESLAAFAQQVSLALTDARTMDAVREAHRDPITGLPNRKLLLQQLERERLAALSNGRELCVLFIDLDRFKAVNDTLGHQAGDELLAMVAQRITSCVRPDDITARLGGDEFAVVLPDAAVAGALGVATRIISELVHDFVVCGRPVSVGVSIGLAPLTGAHVDAAGLLSDADIAMYTAKRSGRGRVAVFEGRMIDDVDNELALRTDLMHAQDAGQLSLAYQPIVNLASGRIDSAEALMRWAHPVRGNVAPGVFIPIAEQTDVILGLGAWALETAAAQAAAWRTELPGLQMCVNVSARQIADPGLPFTVRRVLERVGVAADVLTLEITESSVLGDPDVAGECLGQLKDIGVRIALDDFGTGYSSLTYLRRLPVDIVKIDRSFVSGLDERAEEDIALVDSLITLCDRLRLRTVAEGIETRAQLSVLRELGCTAGQGFYLARPLWAADWTGRIAPAAVRPTAPDLPELTA